MEEVNKKLRDFFRKLLVEKDDDKVFNDSDSIFISGRLDSIDAIELIAFLEDNFGIDFAKIGFDQSLIDSISAVENLITQYGSAQ